MFFLEFQKKKSSSHPHFHPLHTKRSAPNDSQIELKLHCNRCELQLFIHPSQRKKKEQWEFSFARTLNSQLIARNYEVERWTVIDDNLSKDNESLATYFRL